MLVAHPIRPVYIPLFRVNPNCVMSECRLSLYKDRLNYIAEIKKYKGKSIIIKGVSPELF